MAEKREVYAPNEPYLGVSRSDSIGVGSIFVRQRGRNSIAEAAWKRRLKRHAPLQSMLNRLMCAQFMVSFFT